MLKDGKIWVGNNDKGENISIIPKMAQRHGLICGATGTGKTVTLKVMAESFSEMGIPVFISDVKGDVSGLASPGIINDKVKSRIDDFNIEESDFQMRENPVVLWDLLGEKGIQLRTTISEMGPLLLSRVLDLNELQSGILSIVFKIADDNNLLLIDTKDLKSMLSYVGDNADKFAADYGKISSASIGVITRAVVSLEMAGGDIFFGEPALNITDLLSLDNGRGVINILDSSSIINNKQLYSAFMLWLLSELFETLPEVGDIDKPKMIFFFDEAHLLFTEASSVLLDKVEQLVKLIRSKGVGVYFCTQNPNDMTDGVLAQLSNRIEHGLRAYTPKEQKIVKAAAESFRENPDFDVYDAILNLGTGEAVISFLGEDGIPSVAEKVRILPPRCSFDAIPVDKRDSIVKSSLLYSKYANAVDPDSAYEFLLRQGEEEAANIAKEKSEKEKNKADEAAEKARKRTAGKIGNSVAGTVGREVGKTIGGSMFGRFGRTLGGNLGASVGRGILDTFIKK